MFKFLALAFILQTCSAQYILSGGLNGYNGLNGQVLTLAPQSLGGYTTGLSGQQVILLQASPQTISLAPIPRPLTIRAQPPQLLVAPAPAPAPVIIQQAPRPVAVIADEDNGPAEPYNYGYQTQDEEGNAQSRQESSDGQGTVRGSYSYTDAQGLNRIVEYIADAGGYRATVKTNEPGTANANPADVQISASEPPANVVAAYANPPYGKRV